jgi:hypothetical protein
MDVENADGGKSYSVHRSYTLTSEGITYESNSSCLLCALALCGADV